MQRADCRLSYAASLLLCRCPPDARFLGRPCLKESRAHGFQRVEHTAALTGARMVLTTSLGSASVSLIDDCLFETVFVKLAAAVEAGLASRCRTAAADLAP